MKTVALVMVSMPNHDNEKLLFLMHSSTRSPQLVGLGVTTAVCFKR